MGSIIPKLKGKSQKAKAMYAYWNKPLNDELCTVSDNTERLPEPRRS
jgi:hypothetical protein